MTDQGVRSGLPQSADNEADACCHEERRQRLVLDGFVDGTLDAASHILDLLFRVSSDFTRGVDRLPRAPFNVFDRAGRSVRR